jgi:hypothetical protein
MGTIKRTIEKSAEATLNIGEMQFLKVRSMVQEEVEVENEQELLEADTRIWNDISTDLRRGMWKMIKNLGKTTEADKKYFESCAQRVQEATGKTTETKTTEGKTND